MALTEIPEKLLILEKDSVTNLLEPIPDKYNDDICTMVLEQRLVISFSFIDELLSDKHL